METYIVAYGGSIVMPGTNYDSGALDNLVNLINKYNSKRFVFIIGGGKICRNVQNASKQYLVDANLNEKEIGVALDEIGISLTKVNARKTASYLVDKLGSDIVYGDYIDNPQIIPKTNHRVYIASGFRPGVTTDYCTIRLAQEFKATKAFKISNFPVVLNAKPMEFDASKIDSYEELPKLSWPEILDLVGTVNTPGGNFPLDPPSAILGNEIIKSIPNFTLYIGQKEQFEKMIADEPFIGTVVKND